MWRIYYLQVGFFQIFNSILLFLLYFLRRWSELSAGRLQRKLWRERESSCTFLYLTQRRYFLLFAFCFLLFIFIFILLFFLYLYFRLTHFESVLNLTLSASLSLLPSSSCFSYSIFFLSLSLPRSTFFLFLSLSLSSPLFLSHFYVTGPRQRKCLQGNWARSCLWWDIPQCASRRSRGRVSHILLCWVRYVKYPYTLYTQIYLHAVFLFVISRHRWLDISFEVTHILTLIVLFAG